MGTSNRETGVRGWALIYQSLKAKGQIVDDVKAGNYTVQMERS